MEISGILLIDKDKGMYSNRVVEKVRRVLKGSKVGHLGTLDPLCTGLLPLCIGKATRLSQLLMKSDKVYQTTLLLGMETTTYDIEGEITAQNDAGNVRLSSIETELKNFMGKIEQVPPYFSAKKFKGQPLYKYARAGEFIELKPSSVIIYSIKVLSYHVNELRLEVHCSAGMYVRSLAHDLGKKLGCGACCKEIRRIKWKNYDETRAMTLNDFFSSENYYDRIIPLNEVLVEMLGAIKLDEKEIAAFQRGKDFLYVSVKERLQLIEIDNEPGLLRALNSEGKLLGIFIRRGDYLHPHIVF